MYLDSEGDDHLNDCDHGKYWNPCETGAPSEIIDTTETGDTIEPSDTNLKIYDIYYIIYDSYTSKTSET